METVRNTIAIVLFVVGALSVVVVGPALGMNPGVWVVLGGLLSIALAGVISDI